MFVNAGEIPTAEMEVQTAIDLSISKKLAEEGISPAPTIGDGLFLRRLSLDLAGRIPTTKELQDFLALPESERREVAVQTFLAQPDFAFHQANELDLLLLARIKRDNEWRAFLLEATKENQSWSKIFQQVMTPDAERPGEVGPAAFLRERVRELDDLTNDTAVLFFGVNISCAKCHDHPLVEDWQQDHYFGMASFFKRTYLTKSRMLADHFEGDVKFTDILGEEKQAVFMFLSNSTIKEPDVSLADEARKKLEEAIKEAKKDDKAAAPDVAFKPRSELIKLALSDDDNNFFARNIVNRVWARLLGRGLVMPLDQMHSGNPASHPELMDWLVRDLKTHDYDLKRLIAGIVRSDVYALSSRWESNSELPSPEAFAVTIVRPLNPRQLSLSLFIAAANSDVLPGLKKPENWEEERGKLEKRSDGFADLFPIPDEGFQVGTDEALLFSNSSRFEGEFLRTSGDRLVGQLAKLVTDEELIDTAYRSVLSRPPSDEERGQFIKYFTNRKDQREAAIQQVVWTLFASPEFRFNH